MRDNVIDRRAARASLAVVAGLLVAASAGATPLVKVVANVNPAGGNSPENLLVHGGKLWFVDMEQPFTDKGLYVFDPVANTTTRLATDTTWKYNDSSRNPRYLTGAGDRIVFTAYTAATGYALWASDGTVAGTGIIADPDPQTTSGNFFTGTNHIAFGDKVYFGVDDGVHGNEIWRTDGTADGTALLVDGITGTKALSPQYFGAVGGSVWFAGFTYNAGGAFAGARPYVMDPEAESVAVIADGLGPVNVTPYQFAEIDFGGSPLGLIWASDGLYQSDGSGAGTSQLAPRVGTVSGWSLVSVGDAAWFYNADAAGGMEPWYTDGTVDGTHRVVDTVPGSSGPPNAGSNPLVPYAGGVCFVSGSAAGVADTNVWCGAAGGTGATMIADLQPGPTGADPTGLTAIGNTLYFAAKVNAVTRLYAYDGNAVTAVSVPGVANPQPERLTADGDALYFTAVASQGRKIMRLEPCAGCVIDGACVPEDAANPANPCEVCHSAEDAAAWSVAADGTPCSDEDLCTSDDACLTGVCAGTAIACAASGPCETAECLADQGCVVTPINPCDGCALDASTCNQDVYVVSITQAALAAPGAPTDLAVVFGNEGPDPADVTLTFELPAGATLDALSVDPAPAPGGPADPPPPGVPQPAAGGPNSTVAPCAPVEGAATNQVACHVGKVPAGAARVATAPVTNTPSGEFPVSVSASAPGQDPDTNDRTALGLITHLGGELSLTLVSPQPDSVLNPGTSTIKLEVSNADATTPVRLVTLDVEVSGAAADISSLEPVLTLQSTVSTSLESGCLGGACHTVLDRLDGGGKVLAAFDVAACAQLSLTVKLAAKVGTQFDLVLPPKTLTFGVGSCAAPSAPCRTNTCSLAEPAGCKEVVEPSVGCDDGDPCTVDSCSPEGSCVASAKCSATTPCTVAVCTNGDCSEAPGADGMGCAVADDGCFIGTCKAGACQETPIKSCPPTKKACAENRCVAGECVEAPLADTAGLACEDAFTIEATPTTTPLTQGTVVYEVSVQPKGATTATDVVLDIALISDDPLVPYAAVIVPGLSVPDAVVSCDAPNHCRVEQQGTSATFSFSMPSIVCGGFDLSITAFGAKEPAGPLVLGSKLLRGYAVTGACELGVDLAQLPKPNPDDGLNSVRVQVKNTGSSSLPEALRIATQDADGTPTTSTATCTDEAGAPLAASSPSAGETVAQGTGTIPPGGEAVLDCTLPADAASGTAVLAVDGLAVSGNTPLALTLPTPPIFVAISPLSGPVPAGLVDLSVTFGTLPEGQVSATPSTLTAGTYQVEVTLTGGAAFKADPTLSAKGFSSTALECRGDKVCTGQMTVPGDAGAVINTVLSFTAKLQACAQFSAKATLKPTSPAGPIATNTQSYALTGSCNQTATFGAPEFLVDEGELYFTTSVAVTSEGDLDVYPSILITADVGTDAFDAVFGDTEPDPCEEPAAGTQCFAPFPSGEYPLVIKVPDNVLSFDLALRDQLSGALLGQTPVAVNTGAARYAIAAVAPPTAEKEQLFDFGVDLLGATELVGPTEVTITLEAESAVGPIDVSLDSLTVSAGGGAAGYPIGEVTASGCGGQTGPQVTDCVVLTFPRVDKAAPDAVVVSARLRAVGCAASVTVRAAALSEGRTEPEARDLRKVALSGSCDSPTPKPTVSVNAPTAPTTGPVGTPVKLAEVNAANTTASPMTITGVTVELSSSRLGQLLAAKSAETRVGDGAPVTQPPPAPAPNAKPVGTTTVTAASGGSQTVKGKIIPKSDLAAALAAQEAKQLAVYGSFDAAALAALLPTTPPPPTRPPWLLAALAALAVALWHLARRGSLRPARALSLALAAGGLLSCSSDDGAATTSTTPEDVEVTVRVTSVTVQTESGEELELLDAPVDAGTVIITL